MSLEDNHDKTLEAFYPIGCYKLLWAKEKIYIHPTKNKKDNIPGILSICKPQHSTNKEILISFTPEYLLQKQDLQVFIDCDLKINLETKDEELSNPPDFFIKKSLVQNIGNYAFSIPISSIYSIQSRTPNLGWWWGSIAINLKDNLTKLPILFFHDDESKSTLKRQSIKNKEFDPFNKDNALFYGGDQFLDFLKKICVVEKSTLENSVYLINPSLDDLRNFSPLNVKEENADKKTPQENLNKILNSTKWFVLENLAKISNLTKNNVKSVIDESPDSIKQLLKRPEIKKLNDEFDSANIFLARWALSIQEEAEKNKKKYVLDDSYRNLLNDELGIPSIDYLSPLEISKSQRTKEISKIEWDSYFDNTGRLNLTINEIKERIFHGGVNSTIRSEVWLFLLEIYPWDSSSFERKQILKSLKIDYEEIKKNWENQLGNLMHDDYWKDQKFRIEKDVNRNDRHIDLYKTNKKDDDENNNNDDDDVIVIRNPHLKNLKEILLTYNQFNENLGYVQGMCDILSIIYYIYQDSSISFWCFVKFMDRMERNFLKNQQGMKNQMDTLNQLTSLMLPKLFLHLEKCDSQNLFFFFRMLLIWFKREFIFEDVIGIWENFLTNYYSSQFQLFFCLAILSKHEKIIINHLTRFDEVLKYINDLNLTMDKDDLFIRAELLFLRFKKMVEIIDRGILNDKLNLLRKEMLSKHGKKESDLPKAYEITDDLRLLLSKEVIIEKERERLPGEGSC